MERVIVAALAHMTTGGSGEMQVIYDDVAKQTAYEVNGVAVSSEFFQAARDLVLMTACLNQARHSGLEAHRSDDADPLPEWETDLHAYVEEFEGNDGVGEVDPREIMDGVASERAALIAEVKRRM